MLNIRHSLGRQLSASGTDSPLLFVAILALFVAFSVTGAIWYTRSALVLWFTVVIGWIVSLCLHEFAHALTAYCGGDESVLTHGYLSLNVLKYIDPLQSILIPCIILIIGGIALPGGSVLIQTESLRSVHWAAAVSAAGPLSNLLVAITLRLMIAVATLVGNHYKTHLGVMIPAWTFLLYLQLMAAFLNSLPLYPLDGWNALAPYLSPSCWLKRILEDQWHRRTATVISFGCLFIIGVSFPGVLNAVLNPGLTMLQVDYDILALGGYLFKTAIFHR